MLFYYKSFFLRYHKIEFVISLNRMCDISISNMLYDHDLLFCGFIHYYVISIKDVIFDFYISTLKQELSGTEA